MKRLGLKPPLLALVVMLWAGCMQYWAFAGLGVVCACLAFRRRPTYQLMAFAMVGTGWAATQIHSHFHPLLGHPITASWSCKPLPSSGAIPRCTCSDHHHREFIVEWNDESLPDPQPFLGTLWPLRSYSPSFLRWKHRQGISGVLQPLVDFCPAQGDDRAESDGKAWLWNRLQDHFSGNVPGLLFAISSGNKRHLSGSLKRLFNHAGLSHLMAVSGYHVGLVASGAVFLLRRRRQGLRWLGFAGLSTAWAFIGFCGWPDSAVRAGVMLTVYGVSQLLRSHQPAEHALAFAGWWMLLNDPARSEDLGTQLSFLAVLAILTTIRMLQQANATHPAWMYMLIPISAQWGTGVVTWPQFQLFPVHFLWFNLVAPPFMVVIGIAIVTLLLSEVVLNTSCWLEPVTRNLDNVLAWLLNGMEHLHAPHWTLNLERIDSEVLMALSGLFWAIGLSTVYAGLSFRRAVMYAGTGVACLAPVAAWQLEHRVRLEFRHGMAIDVPGMSGWVWTESPRDSTSIARRQRRTNDVRNQISLAPGPNYQETPTGDWLLSFQHGSGIGQQKNRPFAWKRMGGSSMRFIVGADTVWLDQWAEAANVDISSGARGW